MPKLDTILGQIRGMIQDAPRDNLPKGTVWNLRDVLPSSLGANARVRQGWIYRSSVFPATDYANAGIFANFEDGDKLLFVGTDGRLYEIDPAGTSASAPSDEGAVVTTLQNPVQHRDRVIIPAASGSDPAKVVTHSGAYAIADLPGSALEGRYAAVYKDRVLLASSAAENQQIAFSKPGDPTAAWDPISIVNSSLPLTGIAALRSSIVLFHKGSAERIRGTTPPDSTLSNQTGDMTLESFPERVGCADARLIAGWGDNVVWGDERGVYMSDGSLTTSLTGKGGISRLWRSLFSSAPSILSAGVYGDFYLVSLFLTSDPISFDNPYAVNVRAITLVCELPSRSWFGLGNFNAACYVATQGLDSESIFIGDHLNQAIVDISGCFYPVRDLTVARRDEDGNRVEPLIESGFLRLGPPGEKRAQMIFPGYDLPAVTGSLPAPKVLVEFDSELSAPESTSFTALAKMPRASDGYRRDRVAVRKLSEGFAFRFSIDTSDDAEYADFSFFDLGFQGFSVEQMRAR